MVRALRVISVERGFDPRDFTLVAFGGAGGMHACRLAEELGTSTVLVPRAAGVLSALGLAISELRRDYVARVPRRRSATLDRRALEAAFAPLEEHAAGPSSPRPELRRFADLRYRGQSFELTVPADRARRARGPLRARSPQRYGFELPGEDVQVVALRLTATVRRREAAAARRRAASAECSAEQRLRTSTAHGSDVPVAAPASSRRTTGSTARRSSSSPRRRASIRPGWSASIDAAGALAWSARDDRAAGSARALDPVDAVGVRQRACRDRRGDGRRADPQQLLLEHQGAARLLVRAVRRRRAHGRAGRAHPRASRRDARRGARRCRERLPEPGRRLRAERPVRRRHAPARHHARDAGRRRRRDRRLRGQRARTTRTSAACTPGSMPSDSRSIYQEGIVIPPRPARPARRARRGPAWSSSSRTSARRRSAGSICWRRLAANEVGAQRLRRAHRRHGLAVRAGGVRRGDRVRASGGRATCSASIPDGTYAADGEIEGDGVDRRRHPDPRARSRSGRRPMSVDFTGTAPTGGRQRQLPARRSRAPRVCSRCACCCRPTSRPTRASPRRSRSRVPGPSLVDAHRPAAVVAGNVETSQRLADIVLEALGQAVDLPAAGQGTMNNVIIGGADWTYYETIGGGQGASRARGRGLPACTSG